ncbi:hypothetical protein LDENG_00240470 [Lucifuga dentata]|nr:hypothetical protein LDENG_00240470 [Lucifuga dentata]
MSPESGLRERVLKEVGFTSTTFIGPAFLPETARVQPDMEDTLSQFYKELGKVDSADGANENLEKDRETPGTSTNEDIQEKNQTMSRSLDAGSHQEGGRQKQSWQHWYQNEPYPPRPKPSMDLMSGGTAAAQSQRHQPPPFNRPPNPRLHRPPYRHPPPPASFLNPQNQRPHMIPSWNFPATENQRQDESQFHPNFRFPSHASQDFYRDSPQDCEKEERRYSKETLLDDVSAGWCRDAEQQQRSETEKEVWEKQERRQTPGNTNARRSSLVLILMRGLPGSGKSTLAKKLLTGPSGLILSSDDYFSHRDGYRYDPSLVGAAHEWNQSRGFASCRPNPA